MVRKARFYVKRVFFLYAFEIHGNFFLDQLFAFEGNKTVER